MELRSTRKLFRGPGKYRKFRVIGEINETKIFGVTIPKEIHDNYSGLGLYCHDKQNHILLTTEKEEDLVTDRRRYIRVLAKNGKDNGNVYGCGIPDSVFWQYSGLNMLCYESGNGIVLSAGGER